MKCDFDLSGTNLYLLCFVFQTVVDLGSEVTGMKDQVESFTQFMKTANTKLDGMTDKMNEIDMVCIL